MDALGLADAVRRGEISTKEAVAAAVDRIDRVNPAINAAVIDLAPEIPTDHRGDTRPFDGVPILLKDLSACLAGLPLYQGNQLLRRLDWRALEDAPLARLVRAAGFVIVGKTNTPEFGAGAATHPTSQARSECPPRGAESSA